MAQRVQVLLTDDLDGSVATETVTFGLDGIEYEIDLSESNAGRLRETLQMYRSAARKADGAARGVRTARTAPLDYDPRAVRAWAASNHIELPRRGRIPTHVIERYRAAGY